jgi:hypothetical protein
MSVLGAQLAVGEGIAATGIADEVIPAEKVERKPSGDGPGRASPGTQYLFGVSKYLLAEFTVQRSYR